MESPTSLLAAAALRSSPPPRIPRPRRPRPRRTLAGLIVLIAAAVAAPAADADTRTLTLVTDGTFGADPASPAKLVRVSEDGSRVFFHTAEVMAASDTDMAVDGYMRAGAGAPVHLTDNPLAVDKPVNTFISAISADGTHAYFSSEENLVATDTDVDTVDAYERTPAGTLVHLSDNKMGADFDDVSAYVQGVTPDGRHVYFATPEPLLASDTDASPDVYDFGPTGLVHVTDGPAPDAAGFAADFVRASDDGSRVYFQTREKLLPADTDDATDVYVRTATGVAMLTDDPTGPDADMPARFLDVTPDGSRVLFETRESLAATDTDANTDIYERLPNGTLAHVSENPVAPDGALEANYGGRSIDGTRVLFSTKEPLAASDTDTASDVYLRQVGGNLTQVTDGPGPDANLDAGTYAISSEGTRVLFSTSEPLVPTDTDTTADTYLRLPSGALVHLSDDPTGADDALDAFVMTASSDLARVVISTKERLAPTDTDTAYDLYERLPDGKLVHLTDDPTGPDANVDAEFERLSADLRRVYFTTDESLSPADTDGVADGYVATLLPDRPTTRPRPPAADTTAPALTRLQAIPKRSRIRFRVSEAADVRLVVRRRGARARTVTLQALAGANTARVRLRARGRYRVTAVATDAAGNRSPARQIGFRVRGRK
jgi:Tol biopolymer transport system component